MSTANHNPESPTPSATAGPPLPPPGPNTTVTITRILDAPREQVFAAWTDPAQVAQWWSPHGFTTTVDELDVRPGGAMLLQMHGPDGNVYPDTGVFHEIVPPARLVFTSSAIEDEAGRPQLEVHTTVTFEEHNGQTKLTLQAVVVKAAPAALGALAGMEVGWRQSLAKLAEYLATGTVMPRPPSWETDAEA